MSIWSWFWINLVEIFWFWFAEELFDFDVWRARVTNEETWRCRKIQQLLMRIVPTYVIENYWKSRWFFTALKKENGLLWSNYSSSSWKIDYFIPNSSLPHKDLSGSLFKFSRKYEMKGKCRLLQNCGNRMKGSDILLFWTSLRRPAPFTVHNLKFGRLIPLSVRGFIDYHLDYFCITDGQSIDKTL